MTDLKGFGATPSPSKGRGHRFDPSATKSRDRRRSEATTRRRSRRPILLRMPIPLKGGGSRRPARYCPTPSPVTGTSSSPAQPCSWPPAARSPGARSGAPPRRSSPSPSGLPQMPAPTPSIASSTVWKLVPKSGARSYPTSPRATGPATRRRATPSTAYSEFPSCAQHRVLARITAPPPSDCRIKCFQPARARSEPRADSSSQPIARFLRRWARQSSNSIGKVMPVPPPPLVLVVAALSSASMKTPVNPVLLSGSWSSSCEAATA